jgi:hypothetical protein
VYSKTFSDTFLGESLIDSPPCKYRRKAFFRIVYILLLRSFYPTHIVVVCPTDDDRIAEGGVFVTFSLFAIAGAYEKSRNELILHFSSFAFYPKYEIDAC